MRVLERFPRIKREKREEARLTKIQELAPKVGSLLSKYGELKAETSDEQNEGERPYRVIRKSTKQGLFSKRYATVSIFVDEPINFNNLLITAKTVQVDDAFPSTDHKVCRTGDSEMGGTMTSREAIRILELVKTELEVIEAQPAEALRAL